MISSAALAAGGFIVCVVASVMPTTACNRDTRSHIDSVTSIDTGRIVMKLGFVFRLTGWLYLHKSSYIMVAVSVLKYTHFGVPVEPDV